MTIFFIFVLTWDFYRQLGIFWSTILGLRKKTRVEALIRETVISTMFYRAYVSHRKGMRRVG